MMENIKKMNVHQAFQLVRFLKRNKLEDSIYKVYSNYQEMNGEEKENADIDKIGYQLIFSIISSLTTDKAESELMDIFSPCFSVSSEELNKLDMFSLVEGMVECLDIHKFLGFMKSQGILA